MTASITRAKTPVRLFWEFTTGATPDQAWEAFADTDRFNRAAGMGFRFIEEPQGDGTTSGHGRMRRLGMTLRFDDLPFQYRAPEWFRKVRRFTNGPAFELVTLLRIRPEKGGSAIRYTIEAFPRNPLFRPLVALELRFITRPQMEAAFEKLLDRLAGKPTDFDPAAPPLTPEAEARLKQALPRIRPQKLANALAYFLRTAPLVEQDRILPRRLARRWEVPEHAAVQGFLEAVKEGLLVMRWDVVCPSCRAPKRRVESLAEITSDVHCPSCNIRYDGAFADAVEVSFRTAPAMREFEVHTECLGSPGRQPHIVAQDTVEPGAEVDFSLPLTPGAYRLRSWPPKEACSLEVRAEADEEPLQVMAGLYDLQPPRIQARPGLHRMTVRNVTDRAVKVIVERQWRPADLLTAGQLLEYPGARELIPGGALPPSFEAQSLRAGILVAEIVRGGQGTAERIEQHLRTTSPRRLHMADNRIVASYPTFAGAMAAALALTGDPNVRCALNAGTVLEVQVAEKLVPMGTAVDDALAILRGTFRGVLALPEAVSSEADVQDALTRHGAALMPPGYEIPGAPRTLWIRV